VYALGCLARGLFTVTAPADLAAGLVVTAHTVAGVLSAWAGVPVEGLLSQE
jgi:hypothetical protein